MGFDIDTTEETIAAPPPKVDGARAYLLSDEFVVGIQHVALKALQTLCGYMQRWLAASMFWESCAHPADLLLTYGSEGCATVSCPNFQIWCGYWSMISLLQTLARDEVEWPTLFRNSSIRTVALHMRFPGPRIPEEVSWVTTDDAPRITGVAGWRARTYIRVGDESTMRNYVEQDRLQAGIADKELMTLVLGGVDGLPAHHGAVLFIGVGNLNDVAWAIQGKSRLGFARELRSTFLLWFLSGNRCNRYLPSGKSQCRC